MHRNKILQTIQSNINVYDLHVYKLLHGSSDFDYKRKIYIFEAVHEFIYVCDRL